MQLLHEADQTLRSAGFRTARSADAPDLVAFEDETLLGFVATHNSAEDIIASWRTQQDAFLRRNAAQLRRDPAKAWSAYSIFLTGAPVDQSSWELLGIESDVNATRKIVRGGVVSRSDVYHALAPILPLALVGDIGEQSADVLLDQKLDKEEKALFGLMSDRAADEHRIVSWLAEAAV